MKKTDDFYKTRYLAALSEEIRELYLDDPAKYDLSKLYQAECDYYDEIRSWRPTPSMSEPPDTVAERMQRGEFDK